MFEWLLGQVKQAKQILSSFSLNWEITLNPPATAAGIEACEAALGVRLPESYRAFLLQHDGAYLFSQNMAHSPEGPQYGIEIYGTQNLVEANCEFKSWFIQDSDNKEKWGSLILFCCVIQSSDYCGFDLQQTVDSESPVLDFYHDGKPEDWRQWAIAPTFKDWLLRVFETVTERQSHPIYWFEDGASLAREVPGMMMQYGRHQDEAGNYREAIRFFEEALQRISANDLWYASALIESGDAFLQLKEYETAITKYSEVITIFPNAGYTSAYHGRGVAWMELEEYSKAIDDFTQAINANPMFCEAYQKRGDARLKMQDREGAEADYQEFQRCLEAPYLYEIPDEIPDEIPEGVGDLFVVYEEDSDTETAD
jgi:tetratricopeptide (TPR) repeat protein